MKLTLERISEMLDSLQPGATLVIQQDIAQNIEKSYNFLSAFSANKLIYGINTGFGPMAQYRIDDKDRTQLQYNLIRSHSSGMGQLFNSVQCKAIMLARLNTLMLGYSGVHPSLIELMMTLINNEAFPCIYQHGGVGASGDLVQLAHLALGLIGEGNYWYKGVQTPADDVFAALQLSPLKMHIREGLALLNGTSAMTGIGALNVLAARKLLSLQLLFSVMVNEIMEAYDDHFSEELNQVKLHKGQQAIARSMRNVANDSQLLKKRKEHLYDKKIEEDIIEEKVQEYYSIRCVPQILGPIYDTIMYTGTVVENELNSVNDNPIIDHVNGNVYHGGNFHGDYVSLEMDKLKIAVTKLSMLSERQLNFLLNPALNKKLPPFINKGIPGLNFGIQGMQYPAVSNVAENQALSNPMYVHSIPNNNDNQDIVSMGCNAAVMCARVIENSYEVLAVQAIALVQAINAKDMQYKLSSATRQVYDALAAIAPPFTEDEPMYRKMTETKQWLIEASLPAVIDGLLSFS